MIKATRILSILLAGAAAASLLSGCAGYRVGSMLPADVKSVYIPTFINKTAEPLIEIDATQAAIREFQRDGSLQLADESSADAILNVELIEYRLQPVSFRDDRRYAANQYRLIIRANMVLKKKADQTIVAQAAGVTGKYIFDVTGDLTSSKLSANPEASEDLARSLIQYLVEYWPE